MRNSSTLLIFLSAESEGKSNVGTQATMTCTRAHRLLAEIRITFHQNMNGYDYDNDSHAGDPVLLGLTGDACGSCQSSDVPLYDLSCHDSDNFYCRDCLTKKWYYATDEIVRCPACNKDCGFMPLPSIAQFRGISRDFSEAEGIEQLRQQHEVMDNLIGFTAREATEFLQHVYSIVEDQILDPTALGGFPSQYVDSAQESFETNPFYRSLIHELASAPKMMSEPLQLEEDLLKSLDATVATYARVKYPDQIMDGRDEDVLTNQVLMDPYIKDVRENWIIIIGKWVELLAWRHIERTASVEGGAAERLRKPVQL
jgi:hypothetical protein